MHQQFIVPTEQEVLEESGTESVAVDSDGFVRELRMVGADSKAISLVYDIPGKSVWIRMTQNVSMVVGIFREGATLLRVTSRRGNIEIHLYFAMESVASNIRIYVGSSISIMDALSIT